MFSQRAIETVLGIPDSPIRTQVEEMADILNITFYPDSREDLVRDATKEFVREFKEALVSLKVNIVPYENALHTIPWNRVVSRLLRIALNDFLYILGSLFMRTQGRVYMGYPVIKNTLQRRRIKKGISVVAVGESSTGNLPMDNTSSFREGSVITILDMPESISPKMDFAEHFNIAMGLFAHHMTNIVIGVDEKSWILYNFNASHPIYKRGGDMKEALLRAFIPKVVAPIRPCKLSEFEILKERFDVDDVTHKKFAKDIIKSGSMFDKVEIYPPGKKIDDLPFRNDFYRWIGKLHLDERNGMSYGFLARQMPSKLSKLTPIGEAKKIHGENIIDNNQDYFTDKDGNLHLTLTLNSKHYTMRVPDIWVLSQRSGANKTNIDPTHDLIKMGLSNGKMYLQMPYGAKLNKDYKTSFDTRVILAHALGNVIVASIKEHLFPKNVFSSMISENGAAIAHWHGYIHPERIPDGLFVHGIHKPHVACSSPQSAIYAIGGKLDIAMAHVKAFRGDIHIEPHHGTNIIYPSLCGLAGMFIKDPGMTKLGNAYLDKVASGV